MPRWKFTDRANLAPTELRVPRVLKHGLSGWLVRRERRQFVAGPRQFDDGGKVYKRF